MFFVCQSIEVTVFIYVDVIIFYLQMLEVCRATGMQSFCIYHKQEVFVSSNLSIFTVGLFQVMLHPKFDDKICG